MGQSLLRKITLGRESDENLVGRKRLSEETLKVEPDADPAPRYSEVESKRLSEEKLEVEPMLTQRSKVLLQEEKKRLDLEEWQAFIDCAHLPDAFIDCTHLPDAFIDCTHLPDVRKESELSTYIALWEEEHEVDLEKTMQDTQLALDVIRGLESLVSKALVVGDEASVEKNRMYMLKIKASVEKNCMYMLKIK
ncbi:hypothetical protein T484DRAFT_1852413, partial [Baffinella frigidus]